jgi:TPR repeat protein
MLVAALVIAALNPSISSSSEPLDAAVRAYRAEQYTSALRLFEAAARKGNREAQHTLGYMYRDGKGTRRDDAKAFAWYRRSAEQGFAPAEYNLGLMYAQGEGVKADAATARKWFVRAADHGSAEAQFKLGEIAVLDERFDEAFGWFSKAADQGDPDATFNVGSLYYMGRGVAKDDAKATEFYRRAAELGMPQALDVLRGLGQMRD